jgi:acylphosphatase
MSKNKYKTQDNKIILMIMFEGHVQGVSFRYTSNKYAVIAKLSGFVRNTSDGEVELL